MDIRELVEAKARAACGAKTALALTPTRLRNEALLQMARGLEEKARPILEANRADLDRARARGHPRAFLDRLTLTDGRIEEMAQGLRQIAALPDPIGETVGVWRRPNGLEISRVRVPLGVIGFVYESRPNVTADAAGLCLKSGNAVVLRGGSEATESNALIAAVLAKSSEKVGAPADAGARALGAPRPGRGLGYRIPRPDPRGEGRRRSRRGDPPHPEARLGPGRGDRHQRPPAGAPVHPRGRRRRRPCQRVDPPRGRQPVRHGGGDGHLDLPAPRSGPRGPRGVDDHQVRGAGRRAGAGVAAAGPDGTLRRVLQCVPPRQ